MAKKVVFLVNSLAGGGAERVVCTLLNNLADNCNCYLILFENKIDYKLDSRVKIITLSQRKSNNYLSKFLELPILAYKLSNVIKEYKFNTVVSFLYRANYINILAKYFSKHNAIISERIAPSSMYYGNSLSNKISKFLIRFLYSRADFLVPVANAIKDDLSNNFNINIDSKVIYNPYDINKINFLSSKRISININKSKSIITVGSLDIRKNHKLLIKAFSRLVDKEYKLYILGRGQRKNNLQKLASDLGLGDNVIFINFDNNPYKYLSKCCLFVFSSNSEGFPNVVVEALACGLPVISTDCLSGPREILAPGTNYNVQLQNKIEYAEYGILTPINDVERMREAMELLIRNKSLREAYARKAKKRAQNFAVEKIASQYLDTVCVP